jgi:RimJ/RimL family protein N-acetyltransferase
LRITRAVRRAIDIHPAVRIEATVVKGFLPGERWAKALGFKPDGIRERYHEGRDHVAFVLLKSYL